MAIGNAYQPDAPKLAEAGRGRGPSRGPVNPSIFFRQRASDLLRGENLLRASNSRSLAHRLALRLVLPTPRFGSLAIPPSLAGPFDLPFASSPVRPAFPPGGPLRILALVLPFARLSRPLLRPTTHLFVGAQRLDIYKRRSLRNKDESREVLGSAAKPLPGL